jgi:exopolysaccharide biosynthesis protein
VTPADAAGDKPLAARTVSEFVADYGVQLAINGDGFTPWYVVGPVYFPHAGDMVAPLGLAASNGEVYHESNLDHPILYISRNNRATINGSVGNVYMAVSGLDLLVQSGSILAQNKNDVHPRTAVGVNLAGSKLIIVVVDGRQPGYSEGASLTELAEIMLENGARDAMNMDGGGSSTLVMADKNGNPVVLNSPIHLGRPGTERPVANQLGIFARNK